MPKKKKIDEKTEAELAEERDLSFVNDEDDPEDFLARQDILPVSITENDDPEDYPGSLKKSLQLFHALADSISATDFDSMSASKKIEALKNLNAIFVSAKAYAPRSVVFNNFNAEKASIKEIEAKIIEFTDEQTGADE